MTQTKQEKPLPLEPIRLIEDEAVDGQDGTDRLGMESCARVLAGIAIGTGGPFTIGVYGGWGVGKTSLIKQAKELIDHDEEAVKSAVTVWFNAWQFEREEHPLFPLIGAICDAVERAEESPAATEALRKIGTSLRALTRGMKFKGKVGLPLVGEVGVEFDAEKALKAEELLGKQTNPLQAEMLYQAAFKQLARATEANGGGPKIIVFIDDLDRCLPDSALKLLESIKLVLAQKGFVFVLALDQSHVETYLTRRYKEVYGVEEPGIGRTYLHKIVQLEFPVPAHTERFSGYVESLLAERLSEHDIPTEITPVLVQAAGAVPRSAVRLVNDIVTDLHLWDEHFPGTQWESARADVATCMVVGRATRAAVGEALFRALVRDQSVCDRILSPDVDKAVPISGAAIPWLPDGTPDTGGELIRRVRAHPLPWNLMRGIGKAWLQKPKLRQRLYSFYRERETESGAGVARQPIAELAIRAALSLPEGAPIPVDRLVEVTELDLGFATALDDRDFGLLQKLPNLAALDLWSAQITDLAPLAGCASLGELDLTSTGVSDLTPLASIVHLAALHIGATKVSSIEPLGYLQELRELGAAATAIADLSPLADAAGLKSLDVSFTHVTDLAPLACQMGLETLRLDGTRVSDLNPLVGLVRLRGLSLRDTQVVDLAPLAGCAELETLALGDTPVSEEQVDALKAKLPELKIIR